jgi:hypothetical protein
LGTVYLFDNLEVYLKAFGEIVKLSNDLGAFLICAYDKPVIKIKNRTIRVRMKSKLIIKIIINRFLLVRNDDDLTYGSFLPKTVENLVENTKRTLVN